MTSMDRQELSRVDGNDGWLIVGDAAQRRSKSLEAEVANTQFEKDCDRRSMVLNRGHRRERLLFSGANIKKSQTSRAENSLYIIAVS